MVLDARAMRAKLELGSVKRLNRITDSLTPTPGRAVSPLEAADVVAQAAACAAPILAAACGGTEKATSWLSEQLADWERAVLDDAQVLSTRYSVLSTPGTGHSTPAHLFEHFLHQYSRADRKRSGVFFTPQPLADHIVRGVDRLLREEFSLAQGLANPGVTIIDPACGTGVFLLSAIDYFAKNLRCIETLLPRLIGVEILPAAAFLTKLNLTLKLAEAGVDLQRLPPINIITGNALSPNLQSEICNLQFEIPVLLGNPPFSTLSTTTNDWIAGLVRGNDQIRGYVRANGQSLGERKTWLHDDYVKFIRLAQWHVEQAGAGIIGFVTNHGFLDNATFHLMRHELLRVFPRIEIIDLHGNRKKCEQSPDGSPDENLFGLDQGVAISLFCRPTSLARSASEGNPSSTITHSELWGSRTSKLAAISQLPTSEGKIVQPQAPDWLFLPSRQKKRQAEYDAAWSLADAMPVHTTAPVTARDHFVVAFTAEELRARIKDFRDLSIPDDEIRRRYFHRTRSARYQIGDTRGWKLDKARQIIAADRDWSNKILRCLYRPFDWRYVFWHPAMIDWPRHEVTRHLIEEKCSKFKVQGSRSLNSTLNLEPGTLNFCLIARRQQLPTQPCTFFWVSDGLALDGVIRSDNRGSESLFPLYLRGDDDVNWSANFALPFVERFAGQLGLAWLPLGNGDLAKSFGPDDLTAYIYALFHSLMYRQTYADSLRRGFPRVLLPVSAMVFQQLAQLGRNLIDLHLLRSSDLVLSTQYSVLTQPCEATDIRDIPASNQPHLRGSIATFRAGGYVALRKWLQPKHRRQCDPQYARIVAAISRTTEIMAAIDATIDQSGGWARVFSTH